MQTPRRRCLRGGRCFHRRARQQKSSWRMWDLEVVQRTHSASVVPHYFPGWVCSMTHPAQVERKCLKRARPRINRTLRPPRLRTCSRFAPRSVRRSRCPAAPAGRAEPAASHLRSLISLCSRRLRYLLNLAQAPCSPQFRHCAMYCPMNGELTAPRFHLTSRQSQPTLKRPQQLLRTSVGGDHLYDIDE